MPKNLEQLVDGVIDAGMTGGDKAVEVALTAEFPILGAPFVSYLLDHLVSGVSAAIERNIVKFANRIVIDYQVNGEESAVFKAAVDLQVAQKIGDQNEIELAASRLMDSYRSLGTIDNVGD